MAGKKGGNPQQLNTKDIIAQTFHDMLMRQPLDSISVQDIVNACGISRTSFYRHYQDKYDLLIQVYKNQISKICDCTTTISHNMRAIMELMYRDRKYFRSALLHDEQNALKDYIFQMSREHFIAVLQEALCEQTVPDELMTAIDYACAGSQYVWSEWLLGEMNESPQVIAERLFDNIPESVRRYCK